jgi:isohexenylglutaconyl-CoA hydratase
MREILSQRPATESDHLEAPQRDEGDYAARVADNPLARANRQFGDMLIEIQNAPQVVIAVLEGAVMGGGFGLACISDIAFALPSARFGLPEVTLGLTPAQIAPFVVTRIGLTRARQLALTGARFDAQTALSYGLIHELCDDEAALKRQLTQTLEYISKCAPSARAATKELILSVGNFELPRLLDKASLGFAHAARDGEGMAGMMAFIPKQSAAWRQAWGPIGYGEESEESRERDDETIAKGGTS